MQLSSIRICNKIDPKTCTIFVALYSCGLWQRRIDDSQLGLTKFSCTRLGPTPLSQLIGVIRDVVKKTNGNLVILFQKKKDTVGSFERANFCIWFLRRL